MKKRLTIGILFLLLAIILVGCVKQRPVTSDREQNDKKCFQLEGFICTENEACNGKLMTAIDIDKCCSIKCEAKADVGAEVPKFDFGKVNDNLGSLQ